MDQDFNHMLRNLVSKPTWNEVSVNDTNPVVIIPITTAKSNFCFIVFYFISPAALF